MWPRSKSFGENNTHLASKRKKVSDAVEDGLVRLMLQLDPCLFGELVDLIVIKCMSAFNCRNINVLSLVTFDMNNVGNLLPSFGY